MINYLFNIYHYHCGNRAIPIFVIVSHLWIDPTFGKEKKLTKFTLISFFDKRKCDQDFKYTLLLLTTLYNCRLGKLLVSESAHVFSSQRSN